MSARRIHLVRHGETPSNAARVVQTPDTPLSDLGIQQARKLAERFADAPVGLVLASDLRRAVMTAERVQQACGAPLRFDPLLQERNFGALRGTAYADLQVDLFADDFEPPEGESWSVFDERALLAWARVEESAAACDGDLVVVTHGLVCRAIVERFQTAAGLDTVVGPGSFANTSVSIFDGPAPWRLERVACVAHLGEEHAGSGRGGAA